MVVHFPSHNHTCAGWEGHGSRNRRVGSSVYFLNFSLASSSENVVSIVRYAQLQQQPQQFHTKIRRGNDFEVFEGFDVDFKRISQVGPEKAHLEGSRGLSAKFFVKASGYAVGQLPAAAAVDAGPA